MKLDCVPTREHHCEFHTLFRFQNTLRLLPGTRKLEPLEIYEKVVIAISEVPNCFTSTIIVLFGHNHDEIDDGSLRVLTRSHPDSFHFWVPVFLSWCSRMHLVFMDLWLDLFFWV